MLILYSALLLGTQDTVLGLQLATRPTGQNAVVRTSGALGSSVRVNVTVKKLRDDPSGKDVPLWSLSSIWNVLGTPAVALTSPCPVANALDAWPEFWPVNALYCPVALPTPEAVPPDREPLMVSTKVFGCVYGGTQ